MDGVTVIALTCGLLVGLSLGSLAGWAIARARLQADSAHAQMLIAQSHGEAASARTEAAQARAEAAQARSDVAEARSEAAAAHAEAAQVSAEVARAIAQRDAALDRGEGGRRRPRVHDQPVPGAFGRRRWTARVTPPMPRLRCGSRRPNS